MKKYLEVRRYADQSVVKRLDMTGRSEREVERIDDGLNRNLNHDDFYTAEAEYETEQPLTPAN